MEFEGSLLCYLRLHNLRSKWDGAWGQNPDSEVWNYEEGRCHQKLRLSPARENKRILRADSGKWHD